jgi:hypothetical protein
MLEERSSRLFEIVEDKIVFKPLKHSGYDLIEVDVLDNKMDGIFPTQKKWENFAHKIDSDIDEVAKFFIGTKDSGDMSYCKLVKNNYNDITLEFKQPIEMVVGGYRKNDIWIDIVEEVNYIRGEFYLKWTFRINDPLKSNIASGLEIYLSIKDYGIKELS